MTSATPDRVFLSPLRVRSYELDGLGHVNHAVFLNYLEQARFDTLASGGFPPEGLQDRGWAVHVVRIEADYRRECRFGDALLVRTRVEELRNTSMRLRQDLYRFPSPASAGGVGGRPTPFGGEPVATSREEAESALADGILALEARIVAVWIGPDGRPMRIPGEARRAFAAEEPPAPAG